MFWRHFSVEFLLCTKLCKYDFFSTFEYIQIAVWVKIKIKGCRNSTLFVQRNNSKEMKTLQKLSFFFQTLCGKTSDSEHKMFAKYVKTAFYVSRETFWGTFCSKESKFPPFGYTLRFWLHSKLRFWSAPAFFGEFFFKKINLWILSEKRLKILRTVSKN